MSLSRNRRPAQEGFTLLETMIALAILTVGVMAMALLGMRTMQTSQHSKYLSVAGMLASEKIEDLNRWKGDVDLPVCIPSGNSTVGSLTTDASQNTTCPVGNQTGTVAYFDDVSLTMSNNTGNCPNASSGCFAETISSVVNGTTQFQTVYHSPDGLTGTTTSTSAPPTTFHRRWVIEANQPVTGVRRITVLVTLINQTIRPGAVFQMSIVRP